MLQSLLLDYNKNKIKQTNRLTPKKFNPIRKAEDFITYLIKQNPVGIEIMVQGTAFAAAIVESLSML